ncbi:carbon-phosphorus lyase complex subunit PhnI [Ktedonospora formicarum]|uniref:Carbon-phosphorus lyase n=1 Tax=Ktedonospora formicarum TaxID=2778364 RepID=A0A8J3HQJ3_9CHLR|nr:carbon-phosphorus lyase complex subunit PhnI [Ktedonospora formicarum]GHO41957.1 carbon-phosphorus lyase [Ktedonospora formicarum]
MTYVAVKGGSQAVLNAEQLVEYYRLKGQSEPIQTRQIQDQMRLAVDRAMSEGALYAPELAALALKQGEGDSLEASFLLRAYRSTIPRLDYSLPIEGVGMRPIRRISATFKDIPGGQILGPTRDYHLRLLNTLLTEESSASTREILCEIEEKLLKQAEDAELAPVFPKVIESMREQGILVDIPAQERVETEAEPYDITRKALVFPVPRSARLQSLAQADVGSLLAFAYSSVRGYGDAHPTLGEVRVGYLPVQVAHPLTGEAVDIGEIFATECEVVSKAFTDDEEKKQAGPEVVASGTPKFGLGYGFSFGQNEVKAMSMSMLDRVMSAAKEGSSHGASGPAANEEFVLLHSDGIEASGFTAHFKLPHYVTFQANISVLERAQEHHSSLSAESAGQRHQAMQQIDDLLQLIPEQGKEQEQE